MYQTDAPTRRGSGSRRLADGEGSLQAARRRSQHADDAGRARRRGVDARICRSPRRWPSSGCCCATTARQRDRWRASSARCRRWRSRAPMPPSGRASASWSSWRLGCKRAAVDGRDHVKRGRRLRETSVPFLRTAVCRNKLRAACASILAPVLQHQHGHAERVELAATASSAPATRSATAWRTGRSGSGSSSSRRARSLQLCSPTGPIAR